MPLKTVLGFTVSRLGLIGVVVHLYQFCLRFVFVLCSGVQEAIVVKVFYFVKSCLGFSGAVVHPYFFCLRVVFGPYCGSTQEVIIVRIVVTLGVRSEESCLLWQVSPLPECGANK